MRSLYMILKTKSNYRLSRRMKSGFVPVLLYQILGLFVALVNASHTLQLKMSCYPVAIHDIDSTCESVG